eukprot:Nk52_evm1s357 gene=Nk52_evmTU1s357
MSPVQTANHPYVPGETIDIKREKREALKKIKQLDAQWHLLDPDKDAHRGEKDELRKQLLKIRASVEGFKRYLKAMNPMAAGSVEKLKEVMQRVENEIGGFKNQQRKKYEDLMKEERILSKEANAFSQIIENWDKEEASLKSRPSRASRRASTSKIAWGENEQNGTHSSDDDDSANLTKKSKGEKKAQAIFTSVGNPTGSSSLPEIVAYDSFVKDKGGHTGGWTEYDHHVFLKNRRKCNPEVKLSQFIRSVLLELPHKLEHNVEEHENWYCKYLELYGEKKRAIKQWRAKKEEERNSKLAAAVGKAQEDDISRAEAAEEARRAKEEAEKRKRAANKVKVAAWKKKKEEERARTELVKMEKDKRLKDEFMKKKALLDESKRQLQAYRKQQETLKKIEKEIETAHKNPPQSKGANARKLEYFRQKDQQFMEEKMKLISEKRYDEEEAAARLEKLKGKKKPKSDPRRDPTRIYKMTQGLENRRKARERSPTKANTAMSATAIPKRAVPVWRKEVKRDFSEYFPYLCLYKSNLLSESGYQPEANHLPSAQQGWQRCAVNEPEQQEREGAEEGESIDGGKCTMKIQLSPRFSDPRFVTLGMGVTFMLCTGTIYIFSVYTPEIRRILGYRQVDITMVETLGHVGLYCGFTNGWLYDRYGVKPTCITAGIILFCAYLTVFVSCTPGLLWSHTPVAVMGATFFMIGQGIHTMFTAAMLTNVKNFENKYRGKITGMLGGFIGLSGVLFTAIYSAFSDVREFLLFMAFTLCAISFSGAIFIKQIGPGPIFQSKSDQAIAMHEFSSISTEFPLNDEEGHEEDSEALLSKKSGDVYLRGEDEANSSMLVTNASLSRRHSALSGKSICSAGSATGQEITPVLDYSQHIDIYGWELLTSFSYWLLFITLAIEDGVAVMYVNKIGTMTEALSRDDDVKPYDRKSIVMLFAFCNASGRVFWGFMSDYFHSRLCRPWFLLFTIMGMCLSQLFIFMFPKHLAAAGIFIGFCFGGMFALGPVIVSELYGLKHFGTNWGITTLAPASGSFIFGLIFGTFFENRVAKEGPDKAPTKALNQK